MIDVVAVTYDHTHELGVMVNCMLAQTDPRWRLWLIHDGPAPELKRIVHRDGLLRDPRVSWHETATRANDHGHSSRRWALDSLCHNERVILTNADNYYMPVLIEQIMTVDAQFTWWDVIHNYDTNMNHNNSTYGLMNSRLRMGCIDMGAVAVDRRLARAIGFKKTHTTADWDYFEDILETDPSTHKINKVLMVHN